MAFFFLCLTSSTEHTIKTVHTAEYSTLFFLWLNSTVQIHHFAFTRRQGFSCLHFLTTMNKGVTNTCLRNLNEPGFLFKKEKKKTGFLYVALTVLELILEPTLVLNSQIHLLLPPKCYD